MSTEFAGIHHCNDDPNRLNERTRAQVIPHDSQPVNSSVISRDGDVAIVVERGVEFGSEGKTVEQSSEITLARAPRPEPQPMHAGSDDLYLAGAVTVEEHGVGVQPVSKATAHLDHPTPVIGRQEKVATATTQVVPAIQARTPVQNLPKPDLNQQASPAMIVPGTAPRQPQAQPAPAQNAGFGVEKIRVTLRSPKMGTHRLRVNKLSIGESVITLGYIDDDDAVIVEPPMTTDDEDPIEVVVGPDTYKCMYYGFTFEMKVDGYPMLLVVLVRVAD